MLSTRGVIRKQNPRSLYSSDMMSPKRTRPPREHFSYSNVKAKVQVAKRNPRLADRRLPSFIPFEFEACNVHSA